ncbi:hypothetical protein CRG98_045949 [Punica granatum]|uniref:Prolamin-like domain-containing protein n=1 Tax=Punica granatum TaxID=22663 RepID=A0A2I0HPM0_PUNGR|nr:hypothetical protein CRG98_045949 [Punica granatum]
MYQVVSQRSTGQSSPGKSATSLPCCKAISGLRDYCWSILFPSSPNYLAIVKDLCALIMQLECTPPPTEVTATGRWASPGSPPPPPRLTAGQSVPPRTAKFGRQD